MIYTTLDHLDRYLGLGKNLDTVIHFAKQNILSDLHPGRNEIDGNEAYVNAFSYETMPQERAIWEGHSIYGDVHVIVEGNEKIGVSNAADLTLTVRNDEDDFIGFDGPVQQWVHMNVGSVLVVFPEDVHMVKVLDGESSVVKKAVFKFKL